MHDISSDYFTTEWIMSVMLNSIPLKLNVSFIFLRFFCKTNTVNSAYFKFYSFRISTWLPWSTMAGSFSTKPR